jgi:hypothetical protein
MASFASKYSSAMAGDANNAGAPRICKPIISGLVAVLEGMWKKISLPLKFQAVREHIFEPITMVAIQPLDPWPSRCRNSALQPQNGEDLHRPVK